MPFAPAATWNLDVILPGGPMGPAFKAAASTAEHRLRGMLARAEALSPHIDGPTLDAISSLLLDLEAISVELQGLGTFAGCHAAADAVGRDALKGDARGAASGDGSYSSGPKISAVKDAHANVSSPATGRMNHAPSRLSSSRMLASCWGARARGGEGGA